MQLHEKHVVLSHNMPDSWAGHPLSGGCMEFAVSPVQIYAKVYEIIMQNILSKVRVCFGILDETIKGGKTDRLGNMFKNIF